MALNVPLTGSMSKGQLGLVHLPRMWQKGLLKNSGLLPDDYVFADRGFDLRMMDGVGIDPAAFVPFLQTRPSYLETEAWVRAHATKLANLTATNELILNRSISAEFGAPLREAVGISDASFDNGAILNNLDDLVGLHAYLVARRGQRLDPIVPAITPLASGPLGLLHLPRLWGKAVIKAAGALPEGYFSGTGPLDEQLSEAIGMDLAASVRCTADLPSYIAYEGWVRDNATALNAETIAAWNERMRTREMRAESAVGAQAAAGISDATERRSALLNDLQDWQLLHEQLTAAA